MTGNLNMLNNRIFNHPSPSGNNQPITNSYVDNEINKLRVKPSHNKDQFSYLRQNTLEWPDVTSDGNSFNMTEMIYHRNKAIFTLTTTK